MQYIPGIVLKKYTQLFTIGKHFWEATRMACSMTGWYFGMCTQSGSTEKSFVNVEKKKSNVTLKGTKTPLGF